MNSALTPPVMDADFAMKREEWMTLLGSANGHQNCVYRQLYGLIHDASTYWWINETRRLAPRDSSGHPMLNGEMHRLIDRCFFKSQMIGIRRLINPREKKPDRAVYSVPTLIDELKLNVSLLTRSNIFAAQNAPMDLGALRQARAEALDRLSTDPAAGMDLAVVDIALESAIRLHEQIDVLSGKGPSTRSPCDTVRESVLESIARRLDCLGDIAMHVHKFIAHAATPGSIAANSADQIKVLYGQLREALKLLWNIALFVKCHLLDTVQPTATIIVHHPFKYLDQPSLRAENRPELEKIWNEFGKELDSWGADCFNFATAHLQRP